MNKNYYVIGITGKAGSGKDTVAKFIEEMSDMVTHIIGFADPIRTVAQSLGFNISREYKEVPQALYFEDAGGALYDAINAGCPHMPPAMRAHLYTRAADYFGLPTDGSPATMNMTPRRFMQLLGTEVGQSVSRSIWVDYLNARVRNIVKYADPSFCTQILVPDVRFPHELAVVDFVLGVERPGLAAVEEHVSEKAKIEADYCIVNNHDLAALEHRTRRAIGCFKERIYAA